MSEKVDLRIVKTKRNIKEAFVQLLNEKDFLSITVQDILDRALINRSTFYRHYEDKYELAESLAGEFLADFRAMTSMHEMNRSDFDTLMEQWDETFKTFHDQRRLILGLWKIRTDKVDVYESMTDILKQQYIMLASGQISENFNIEYQARIFSVVTMTTLSYMMENDKRYTASELIKELQSYYGIISIAPPKDA